MKRDTLLYIEDILTSIDLIEKYVKNRNKTDFCIDMQLQDSVIRRLEIIGEAVKNISHSIQEKYPAIPWKDIAGFRDVVSHAYFGVVPERIWEIVNRNLPVLKTQFQKIKSELESE